MRGLELCAADGPLPQWLADALMQLLKLDVVQRRLWIPYIRDLREYLRFTTVRTARRRGLTWESAFKAAAEELKHTTAFGSPAAMKKSYQDVSKLPPATLARYALYPVNSQKVGYRIGPQK